jgi:hypothetical protein
MFQEYDRARQVYVNRDAQGVARELLHFDHPVKISERSPLLKAGDYLRRYGGLFGISAEELGSVATPPSTTLTREGVQYRRLAETPQSTSLTVSLAQTALGVPVWQAGVAVTLLDGDSVVSSLSTILPDVKVAAPPADALKRLLALDGPELARLLGLDGRQAKQLRIEGRRLVVYRYRASQRIFPPVKPSGALVEEGPPTLPLPPVPATVSDGMDLVCAAIDFALPVGNYRQLHWVALVAARPLCVLYLRAFTSAVTGQVFVTDPATTNNGPLPSATAAALDAERTSVTLQGLAAPVGGVQSLSGNYTVLQDVEPPAIAPPTEPANTSFDFDARTDNFSAVNAYDHCDAFFRLVQSLGFDVPTYFGGTTFPMPADHRGSISAPNGVEVNAHCVGTAGGSGIQYTSFMLADTGDTVNPIGIADDYRVVLHELGGHGTLYNHVSSANFHFSHSAGDSVAVITNDPGGQAPDRFVSFPWVNIGRRHDRDPAAGWGWSGSIALNPFDPVLDGGGYNNEQILSTTLFRLYRSLGGDDSDLGKQTFAARYGVYLILRAIGSLTPATSPTTASGFATALMTADLGDWTSEGQTGGANGKVIRWTFEKQGMYQPAGTATPNNNIGAPPAIDVYIDDGRGGEYPYQPVFWENQSIWNRLAPDGGTTHQEPIVNTTNYAYATLKNRGSQTATGVIVQGYHANPSIGLSYPIDWQIMTTPALAAADVPANNAGTITVGPFEWTPTHVGHECMFMIVSCPGDASNASNIAAGDTIPEWRIVPNDNNIGQRNVAPVPGGGGLDGLLAAFQQRGFTLKNPLSVRAAMQVEVSFPAFLRERGWTMRFLNPGAAAPVLDAGATKQMVMQIIPGGDFTAADAAASPDKMIRVIGRANGFIVGGLSFAVDPTLLRPPVTEPGPVDGCIDVAKKLVECLDVPGARVSKVRVRRIIVEIDFADKDCC